MGSMSWGTFVSIGNGTQILNHGWDQCVAVANRYHEEVIGGSFVPVPSAFMWWTNFWSYATLTKNYIQIAAGDNPRAGDIFISRYGLYNAPHGHIGVVIRDWDGSTFGTLEQNAGTWRYTGRYNRTKQNMLGYLRPRNNPATSGAALSSSQRQAGSEPVNRRIAPNTAQAPIEPQLKPGDVGNFDGWIRGENVNGIDIWFRGISGNWFWSGGFTSRSVDGLTNLNPTSPAISANQRRAGALPINRRTAPNTGASKVDPQISAGTVVTMAGWIKGESVEGIDTWFKSTDGTWSWAGAYTSADTSNLTNLAPAPTPPTPTPDPTKDRRTVGSEPVRRRREPNTTSEAVEPMLSAGETITVAGWIKGQSVEGIDIWYKGLTGFYSWAGAFTSQSTEGLVDLNPVTPVTPPAADERTVGSVDGFRRSAPTRNSAADPVMLKAGEKVKIAGWITGEVIDGIGTWYKVSNTNLYAWAGVFTKTDTFGLVDLNSTVVTPGPVPDTGRQSVAELIPAWDEAGPATNPVFPRPLMVTNRYQLPADINETSSNVSSNGYTVGRPTLPESVGLPPINHFVLHHVAGTSLSGAINTLSGSKGAPTTSYVVQDKNLVSMVPEDCAPWTNGRWKSNLHSITFEMVNAGGSASSGFLPPSDETCETVAHAMARACMRWNMAVELEYGINVFGHKDVSKSATACPGGLDVKKVVARANEIMTEYKQSFNPDQGDGNGEVAPTPPKPGTDDIAIAEALDVINEKIEEISNILKGKE
jgi:hypothetical protein